MTTSLFIITITLFVLHVVHCKWFEMVKFEMVKLFEMVKWFEMVKLLVISHLN